METITDLIKDVPVPKMVKIREVFDSTHIPADQIAETVQKELSREALSSQIKPGMRIAITCGSRGINHYATMARAIVDFVKSKGAEPYIVAAMGSHGGATAAGQTQILTDYGITEENMGCPIKSSMETVQVGLSGVRKQPVFVDKNASEADGIILFNRIKPHTSFRGRYESGLMKMMAIGLGKQYGAEVCHAEGFKNMAKNVPMFGRCILKNAPILFGVPMIENAFDETCKIVAVAAEDIEAEEPGLLKEAFTYMPRILVDSCDVLIVDQIGKNFSGDGMDPNITGTFCTPYATGGIDAQRVAVLDLSPETHGNGIGLGYSSATTKRVFNQLDLASMYPNAITCTVLGGVRIPIVMESDKETIQVCIKSCNEIDKSNPRVVRIPNSLHIEHIMLSESYWDEAQANPNMEIESEPEYLPFDEDGNLW